MRLGCEAVCLRQAKDPVAAGQRAEHRNQHTCTRAAVLIAALLYCELCSLSY